MGLKPLRNILTRFFITFVIVLFVRSGEFLPIPGLNHNYLAFAFQQGLITRNWVPQFFFDNKFFIIGVFTLNIFPVINASIIVQLLVGFSQDLSKLQKEGDFEGRRTISLLSRKITLISAIIQSIGITLYLRPVLFGWNVCLAGQIVIWSTAGAMIMLWLSDVITEYGLGNGIAIFIYINIISSLPNIFSKIIEEINTNSIVLSGLSIFVLIFLILLTLYGITLLENSTFHINLISSKRLFYNNRKLDELSYLPVRFNQAGVMPIVLAASFLLFINRIPQNLLEQFHRVFYYFETFKISIYCLNFLDWCFDNYKWIYWIGYAILIFVFSSFYSSIVLNPKDISDDLQRSAVKIQGFRGTGVRPGAQTTYYLKKEIKRITFIGTSLLVFISAGPIIIESKLHITSLNVNGLITTSILILGGVVLDIEREISNIIYSEIYEDKYY